MERRKRMKKEPLSSRPPLKSAIEKYNEEADAIREAYKKARTEATELYTDQINKGLEEEWSITQRYQKTCLALDQVRNQALENLAKKFL
jgi:DNA repair ATPase RecN